MLFGLAAEARANGGDLSPISLVADEAGGRLFVAEAGARQVAMVDPTTSQVDRTLAVSGEPTGLALSPDGLTLYVTCAGPEGTIDVFDVPSGRKARTLHAGHTPMAPVSSKDGRRLFVCNRFDHSVSVIDTRAGTLQAEMAVAREPVAACLLPDGKRLLVANHLPSGRADGDRVAAVVSVIDLDARRVAGSIRLPNGSTGLRDICVSPDGHEVYVTHVLARYQLPVTQIDRGWVNTSALTVIDVAGSRLLNTVLLDDVDRGAANPWGVACTPDGRYICVAHAGTHEISVIDRAALLDRLARVAAGERVSEVSATPADVPNDLSFLAGIRRRVKLAGNGPRGLIAVGTTICAAEYFTDSLAVIDLAIFLPSREGAEGGSAPPRLDPYPTLPLGGGGAMAAKPGVEKRIEVVSLPLGPKPVPGKARQGEMLFNDATICFQHWQSCASCHPDGRTDGLNWDLLNDGIGNSKNTRSLLKAHETPPAMSLGVRSDAETAVRAGFRNSLLASRPEAEAEAIDAYLRSLEPVASPYLQNGRLSPAAEHGRQVFEAAGCRNCHPAPLYTDTRSYDVGTSPDPQETLEIDTPALIEVWRTAPYLHDGRAATVEDVFKRCNPEDRHGHTSDLSPDDLAALAEFVLSQ